MWKSFGFIHDKSGKRIHPDQVYCTLCFESGTMKGYKESVSTTNLAQHLREAHGILVTSSRCNVYDIAVVVTSRMQLY